MPLDYADFSQHYASFAMSETQSRAHFASFAGIMECLVRYFWNDAAPENQLGISFGPDALTLMGQLSSTDALFITFNAAAADNAPGKTKEL